MHTYLIESTHDDYVITADDPETAEIAAEMDYDDDEYTVNVIDITDEEEE
jgi:hypothetical protein